MRSPFIFFAAWLALSGSFTHGESREVEALKFKDIVTEIPKTTWNTLKFSFQRDSVPAWTGIIASTALLYQYDGDIYEWAMGQGRRWNLNNNDQTKTFIEVGPYPILRLPTDTGSALYFLGDGWMHFGIAAGFLAYGNNKDNNRAWNTGIQILHGMGVSTIFNQILKRSTGRESPNHRTEERGVWRPFPDMQTYASQTATYDAFPSGHVMTATLVFTTIRLNYPEYDNYLLPLQVVWSSALMFQMVNNGVHWASDYPLGIAMGWAVAKMAFRMGPGGEHKAANSRKESEWVFMPGLHVSGERMLTATRTF